MGVVLVDIGTAQLEVERGMGSGAWRIKSLKLQRVYGMTLNKVLC